MKKTIFNLAKDFITVFIITVASTACSSKLTPGAIPSPTPIPIMTIQSTPALTEVLPTIPPILPTITSTSLPLLPPADYLLTVEELPVELFKSYTFVYLRPDGSITSSITFFNPGTGRMENSITVSAQPYLKIPYDVIFGNNTFPDALLGENSIAYKNNGLPTYIFYKGNALISISGYLSDEEIAKRGELSLDDMVNLGKVIEARLPNELPLSPITFPEQLDQAEYDQFLKSLALTKQESENNNLNPIITFSTSDTICLSMEFINEPQSLMFAIFDVQDNLYIQKYIPEHSNPCTFITSSHPGQYEMRLAINDKLVAILPFEVQ